MMTVLAAKATTCCRVAKSITSARTEGKRIPGWLNSGNGQEEGLGGPLCRGLWSGRRPRRSSAFGPRGRTLLIRGRGRRDGNLVPRVGQPAFGQLRQSSDLVDVLERGFRPDALRVPHEPDE